MAFALLFTIALGLGSNVTVLGFIRGLAIRNSLLPAASGIVSIFGVDRYRGTGPVSYEDYQSLKSHIDAFDWMGGARVTESVIQFAGNSAIVSVADVTPDLASLFHLSPDDGVIIGRRLWRDEFRGAADVVGKQVHVGGIDTCIVGIASDKLNGLYSSRTVDVWRPLREASLPQREARIRNFWVLGRLRPHVAANQVENTVLTASHGAKKIKILPYTGMTAEMAEGLRYAGALLQVATAFVFFVACVNVASFLLGRATFRLHANAIRVALGVSRGRLIQAIVSDSVVISVAGGALSVLLASWTLRIVPAMLFERDAESLALAPDLLSIAATSATGIAITMVCGLLPLLEIRHNQPAAVLVREGSGPSKVSRYVRAGLLMSQMACCCLLVICSGFLYAGFRAALWTGINRGLGQAIVATVHVHPDVTVDLGYFRNVEQAARSLAGVSSLTWTARLPGSEPALQSFRIEPEGLPGRVIQMDTARFTSNSVAEFSWPPKAGRSFGLKDEGCRAAIVNEEAAGVLFGDNTPGRSILDATGKPVEIIGVVAERRKSRALRKVPTIYYNSLNQVGAPPGRIAMAGFFAPVEANLDRAELNTNVVSADYFATMGLPLVAGHLFSENTKVQGCRTAVVNEEAADLYFGGNAVGGALIDDLGQRTEIIGVVHSKQLGAFERHTEPTVYLPMIQDCLPTMTLIIGSRTADKSMLAKVRDAIQSTPGAGTAAPMVTTLEKHLSQTALAPLHIATVLVGACTATALILCILGLYGALSDSARARRRDLGIRMALGARRRDVIRQILREGGQLAGIGALAGLLGSLVLSRLLYQVAPIAGAPELWIWMAGPSLLAAVVVVASAFPARRALMLDPLHALRGN